MSLQVNQKFTINLRGMSIQHFISIHYAWLVTRGYTQATPLESLALIAGEIGEAVNCCRYGTPDENLPEELADIVLRTMGLARILGIDLEEALMNKIEKNYASGDNRGRTI